MKHWHFDGRGTGKTEHLINAVLQRVQEQDSPNILIITPNHNVGRMIRKRIEDAWVKMRGPEWLGADFSDGHLELDDGESTAHIYFIPSIRSSFQQVLGYRIDFVAGDEYQSWDPDAYPAYEALLRRQSERPDEYLTISEREES